VAEGSQRIPIAHNTAGDAAVAGPVESGGECAGRGGRRTYHTSAARTYSAATDITQRRVRGGRTQGNGLAEGRTHTPGGACPCVADVEQNAGQQEEGKTPHPLQQLVPSQASGAGAGCCDTLSCSAGHARLLRRETTTTAFSLQACNECFAGGQCKPLSAVDSSLANEIVASR